MEAIAPTSVQVTTDNGRYGQFRVQLKIDHRRPPGLGRSPPRTERFGMGELSPLCMFMTSGRTQSAASW